MRNPAFSALIDEIKDLHEKKNADYASDADPLSNFRKCEAFGVPAFKGVLVRLSDKWSRIEQLTSGKTPKNESLRDSLIDSAVYALLAVLLLDEQGVPNSGTTVPDLGTEPESVSVGPQGYVRAESLRMQR